MSTLQYSHKSSASDRMALACAIISNGVGLGGNVWGALAAWSIHAVAPGSTLSTLRLEGSMFIQAMVTAIIGVGFGLVALMKGRGRVGIVLLACAGIHFSLTPYLVSNVVLDYLVNKNGLILEP